jgi:DNA-binding CsgD family transcriptional regulator
MPIPGFGGIAGVAQCDDGSVAAAYALNVASSGVYARARGRVVRICDSVGDALTLRLRLVEEIGRVVGFDAYAWLMTDPETSVGSAPLADIPLLPELPRQLPQLIRLKYLTTVNRWTTLGGAEVALLREGTRGDLSRSLLWRELLDGLGVIDVASSVFKDRFGCWGFLDLWRSESSVPFSRADAAFLAGITEPVTMALRASQANTFLAPHSRDARQLGPVVLLLSPDLEVLGQTPETQAYLQILVPPAEGRAPIPASAYNVAAQLLAAEAGIDRNPPTARVHLSAGLWVTLRAARIGNVDSSGERNVAVSIEETSPAERVTLFARAFGLTVREAELLDHLTTGNGTREIAHRMFLSEHTVQDHLKSIFAKTGLRNRRTVLSRALGT